ncbi:uncharacterized protein LOC126897347 [Daktulosphaira vitifoliae]|uniref:uncharacterized protein LOC126897347 n=1 Tax=Daktulosphaira vitifoliae TaxID=58002 RepID=UPI0021AAEEE2|nr:uncharacterized protein LOC126897347 [Daktulosphaira vitifoliae]
MASRNRDIGRKYDSGSAKRKRNKKRKVLEGQLRNTLTKLLKAETSKNGSDIEIPKKTVTCGPLGLHSASLESPETHNHSTPADPSSLTPQSVSATLELQLEHRSAQQPVPGSPLSRDLLLISSTPSFLDPVKEKYYQFEA